MTGVLLRGASVLDGTGRPAFGADVRIDAGRIVEMGRGLPAAQSERVLDLQGLTLSPGFIDMHSHSDVPLLEDGRQLAKVAQGVTTEVLGQDGLSFAPVTAETLHNLRGKLRGWYGEARGVAWSWTSVRGFLERLDRHTSVNVEYLIPHGTVRLAVMGDEDRAPTPEELSAMAAIVETGMQEGAVGLSTGLTYTPAAYSDDDEIQALARVVARHGGYYCPHHRNYGSNAVGAYADCIKIAEATGVGLHLAHLNMNYSVNAGRAQEVLDLIDAATARGTDITFDTYPYLAGMTYLHALLPSWVQRGGHAQTLARLADPQVRPVLKVEMEERGSDGTHGLPVRWDIIQVSGVATPGGEAAVGHTIAELAASSQSEPFDVFCKLLLSEDLGASCIVRAGHEGNVRTIMRHPLHTAGSDGILHGSRPHPRGWGTFPRYLGHYVRDEQVLTLPECVRQMTSLPARRLGWTDRGTIELGMAADLVCFDPATVADTATYENPRSLPIGIHHVLVNGELVLLDGAHTSLLPGRALGLTRRPAQPTVK